MYSWRLKQTRVQTCSYETVHRTAHLFSSNYTSIPYHIQGAAPARQLNAEEAAARAAREAEALRTLRISANHDVGGRAPPRVRCQGENT